MVQVHYYLLFVITIGIKALLVRWWYSIEWPTDEDIGEAPSGYESLDGFKGVFISTRVIIN